jgi:hypothetical protein
LAWRFGPRLWPREQRPSSSSTLGGVPGRTPPLEGTGAVPTVIWHLWSVKGWGASPKLVLPKVMPADVRGTVDMEKVEAAANPTPYWIAMVGGVVRMLFPSAITRIEAGIGQNTGASSRAAEERRPPQ